MSSQKEKTEKKKTFCSTSDNISCLPDEAIEKILTHLPLQEAAKTCILSRKWRFMWRQIPEIIFDDYFCEKAMLDICEDDIISTIEQVLLLHTGSILKFKLSSSRLVSSDYVDRVIYSVLKRGIKDFTYTGMVDLYKLPLSLFSCEQLELLSLCRCIVTPPTRFLGFGKLVSLKLHRVCIHGDVCSSLISSCCLLERLTLKNLTLCDHLEIVAPNLRFLKCRGTFSCISLNTPRLESLSILHKLSDGEAFEPVVLFDSLPALQFLELSHLSLKYAVVALMGGARNRLANELNHLKVLQLYDVSFGNRVEAVSVFSLIRSSKDLEKLTIRTSNAREQGFWGILELSGISFDHLREVKMESLSGTSMEFTFIQYIMANAPKLLNMVVVPQKTSMTLMILKEVIQFRRESRLAKIICGE